MGIDQWEWEGMGILTVLPHSSTCNALNEKGHSKVTTLFDYFSDIVPTRYWKNRELFIFNHVFSGPDDGNPEFYRSNT